jgi:hypothetical protein
MRVEVIVGGINSEANTRSHACAFFVGLQQTPRDFWIVSAMGHKITDYSAGLDKLFERIVNPTGGSGACQPI